MAPHFVAYGVIEEASPFTLDIKIHEHPILCHVPGDVVQLVFAGLDSADMTVTVQPYDYGLFGILIETPVKVALGRFERLQESLFMNERFFCSQSGMTCMRLRQQELIRTDRVRVFQDLEIIRRDALSRRMKRLSDMAKDLGLWLMVIMDIPLGYFSVKPRRKNNNGAMEYHLWIDPKRARELGLPSRIGYCSIEDIICRLRPYVKDCRFFSTKFGAV